MNRSGVRFPQVAPVLRAWVVAERAATASLSLRGPTRNRLAVGWWLVFEARHHRDSFRRGCGHGRLTPFLQITTERFGVILRSPVRAACGGDEPVAEDILIWRRRRT